MWVNVYYGGNHVKLLNVMNCSPMKNKLTI